MLKTERMTRVLVMGTMDALHDTVDYLYDTRSFHIVDFTKDELHDIGTPLPEADATSAKLLRMLSISTSLQVQDEDITDSERVPVEKLERSMDAALSHMELEISAEIHARMEIEALLAKKRAKLESIMPFYHVDFSMSWLRNHITVSVLPGYMGSDPEPELRALTDAYEILTYHELFILVIYKKYEQEALKILEKNGFVGINVPPISEIPVNAVKKLKSQIKELEDRLEVVNGRLGRLRDANSVFISAALEELTIKANKAEAPLRFGTSKYSFIIDAWIPRKSLDNLKSGLSKIESGVVDVAPVHTEKEEEPPILLDNPKAVAPMEMLLEMFSLPSYDEIDPAFFMFISFPLFYGLMLGDIGYGLVIMLLVLSGAFSKLMTKLGMAGGAPGLSKILLYCSISSIIFGFLFDEVFGFEFLADYINFSVLGVQFPIHMAETQMVGPMLAFCVFVGVIHMMIGHIAGFRNVWVREGFKRAVLEKGGWCLILAGFSLFAFSAMPDILSGTGLHLTNPQELIGLVLLGTGIVMAVTVEGINTVLELPGMAGNLLSYTRIYAIGLSSVGIALAFNEYMAVPMIEAGGFGIIAGALILVAGHTMNIGLGIMGPLIQSLRLHYVEFFSKFYRGGGIKFNPLKYNRKYTKEV